ncbi:hypothetical protein SAMN05720606_112193 [Paenibacillus polysaccharolyticus]|uniref:Uncharacterized protein n=1 Tax=Paenibacillus polysaccharolyticus TaxID=582692 RepID=A0A1G5JZU1_9BACL|nr:hypothetical protein [Paenibacillus polysaccharolyticus]SCY93694.1 hypothetical protein SAMN05720606_112193 [Paenibacillus polysaccharolyticus]
MNLRKGFIIFLVFWLAIGTMLPTSGYALSDPSASIITSEITGDDVNRSTEDAVLLGQADVEGWDPDFYEEPEDVNEGEEHMKESDPFTVTDDTYGEHMFTTQAAALANETLVMNPGESYTFTNTGTVARSLSINASTSRGSAYDYANYRPDGSISGDNLDFTGSITVNSGYTIVITSSGKNPFTVTVRPEFSYGVSTNPAMHRVTLSKGESYRFFNEGSQSRVLSADTSTTQDKKIDYAVYKEDGSLVSSNFQTTGKPSVAGGNEVIITGAGSQPVSVGFPYEVYTGDWSDEPAYTRVTLNQGESYQFTNISSKSDALQSDGTSKDKHDYVVYLPDGTESTTGTNSTTKPTIAAGRTAVVTLVTSTPVTYGVPYRTFDVQRAGGDAITRVTVYPGESVIFRNNGSLANPIKNNASSANGAVFDYTLYTSENVVHSDGFNKNINPIIRSQGYAVVSVVGQVPIEFSYTDDFSFEYSLEPSHHRVTLNQGESVTFWNYGKSQEYLDSDASSNNKSRLFDYVTYYPDGTERSTKKSTSTAPVVFYGNKAVITGVSSQPVTIGAIYTIFDVEDRPNEALSKITVEPGQSVKFHNGGSLWNPIRSNAKSVASLYDIVVYKSDGKAYSDKFNNNGSLVNIPSGGEAIVTVVGSKPALFEYTDDFSVVNSQEPAYLRVTLNKGESYAFTNISSDSKRIRTDASSNQQKVFDYIIYNSDGTESSKRTAVAFDPLVVGSKKIVVTNISEQAITYGGIYRIFRGQDDEVPSPETEITVKQGQSAVFTNPGSTTALINRVGTNSSIVDFVVYEGTDKFLHLTAGSDLDAWDIPAGGTLVMTAISSEPVTIQYSAPVIASPSQEPALLKRNLEPNTTAIFSNTSSFSSVLFTSQLGGLVYDYVIRNQNQVVVKEGENAVGPQHVPGRSDIQVHNVSDQTLKFVAPYRNFTVKQVEVEFMTLYENTETELPKVQQGNVYYRFSPYNSAKYRIAIKESEDFSIEPRIELYEDKELSIPLVASVDQEQVYGEQYTVLEWDLQGGKTYYLKLSEKNGKTIKGSIKAATMRIRNDNSYEYGYANQLLKVVLYTGDQIVFEYDRNGNLTKRTKKIFPFN